MDVVAGDLIQVREGVWRVMEVRTFARIATARTRVLKLVGADAVNRWQPCTLLEPFDRPRRVEAGCTPRVVSRARWMRMCAALVAASPPAGCPATIADAQVTLMPHQMDPVLALLRGRASRLLLADAVGLGKTIQAALIVRELRARGCADRVLVLVPSGLRDQWRDELSHRTGLRADIIDAASLAARVRDLPPDVNPWSLPGILIVSLDFIKQPSVLHGASAITWDILIADEAHNLNEGTDRLVAADLLARHSRHVVLLTATPHHGSDDAFATLCRVGRLGDADGMNGAYGARKPSADPIVIFRRTRHTMGMPRTRKVHVLRVTPTTQERRLHALLARYASRVERECERGRHDSSRTGDTGAANAGTSSSMSIGSRDGGARLGVAVATDAHGRLTACIDDAIDASKDSQAGAASLAMSILLKRASSSASSLERSLRRRLALLDSQALTAPDAQLQRHTQPALPFDFNHDDGGIADGEPSNVLGAPGLRSARIERAWLTLLIEVSRNASRAESKPRALARLLRRCREPVLIYTEYRDTLTHLARTLPDRSSHALLHGGLGADDRRKALARFASGDASILLTTDAAGEGLNLHHRCRLVINVELPWNPNRLEQRIGRLDRLGQTRTVHAIHLVAAGTAEEPMLTRLDGRITQIAATLGDAPAVLRATSENVVADGSTPPKNDSSTCATCADDSAVSSSASDVASSGTTSTSEADRLASADACIAHRAVSAEALDVAVRLQHLRAMRARAWRASRRHAHAPNRMHSSRGDPLLALDERAPLIAVVRRRRLGTSARDADEQEACPSQASPLSLDSGARCTGRSASHPCDSTAPPIAATAHQRSDLAEACAGPSTRHLDTARQLPASGLLCVWRTRVKRDAGTPRSRAGPPAQVLTVMHVACDVPNDMGRKSVAAFVGSVFDRGSPRIRQTLDRELAVARERLDATDCARNERLARRDDALAAEMTAMLRARAAGSGAFQPLLFEDIATEKTAMAAASRDGSQTHAHLPLDADAGAGADVETLANASAATMRVESTLVMVLLVR